MRWLLDNMGIDYIHTFEFKRKEKFKNGSHRKYFIDIVIPDKKIAIECDGYHHTKQKEYDIKRQSEIEKEGWVFLRFTDKQIRKDLKSYQTEIERIIKNHNNEYEFIYLPVKEIEIHTLKKGVKTYNLSVEKDESYIVRYMCSHNCVHSSSPFLITEDENGPRIWGRDDLTSKAKEQLKNAGLTGKGTIRNGLNSVLSSKAKAPVNMKNTNLAKNNIQAMKKAENLADQVYFSKTMNVDGLNETIFAIDESLKRFPSSNKLSYLGLKDKVTSLIGSRYKFQMGKRTSAMFVRWSDKTNMIVFRNNAINDAYIRSKYKESSEALQKRLGGFKYDVLLKKGVDKNVITILEKQKMRHWALSGELGGTKGIMYHEYGHKIFYMHSKKNELRTILNSSYRKGWALPLGKYAESSVSEYFSEAFSCYMQGLNHLLDPDVLTWLKNNDLGG
jgi:very-short-patch-repair endonuclease